MTMRSKLLQEAPGTEPRFEATGIERTLPCEGNIPTQVLITSTFRRDEMSPESRSSVRDVTPLSADARDSGIELWNGVDKEEATVDQLEEVEEYFGQ